MKKTIFSFLISLLFNFNLYAATDLNKASQAELESLSGIGPTKAKAIIEYRKQHGGFNSVDELEKVDGIGPATIKKISQHISVSPQISKAVEVPSKGHISSSVKYD